MTREALRERLFSMQDTMYQAFQNRLIPNAGHLVGVRMPQLHRLAAELIQGDWRGWLDGSHEEDWYEEDILCALVIAQAPMSLPERFQRLRAFVPRIRNWAVCDCLCSALRIPEREVLWDFLQPELHSAEEFPARGYNARMGVAWAYSVCGVKFPRQTLAFLQTAGLDDWTHDKALQKMLESRRFPSDLRQTVRLHKRKGRSVKPR